MDKMNQGNFHFDYIIAKKIGKTSLPIANSATKKGI